MTTAQVAARRARRSSGQCEPATGLHDEPRRSYRQSDSADGLPVAVAPALVCAVPGSETVSEGVGVLDADGVAGGVAGLVGVAVPDEGDVGLVGDVGCGCDGAARELLGLDVLELLCLDVLEDEPGKVDPDEPVGRDVLGRELDTEPVDGRCVVDWDERWPRVPGVVRCGASPRVVVVIATLEGTCSGIIEPATEPSPERSAPDCGPVSGRAASRPALRP